MEVARMFTRKNKELEEQVKRLSALMDSPMIRATIEAQKIADEKRLSYDKLVKAPFSYEIIQDFVNAASHGVVVKFIVDGIPIEIKRDEPEKKNKYSSDLF